MSLFFIASSMGLRFSRQQRLLARIVFFCYIYNYFVVDVQTEGSCNLQQADSFTHCDSFVQRPLAFILVGSRF
jgi:hypothetical protein